MKAITINEILGFERGLNPKAAMGTGGLTLDTAYETIIKSAIEKWDAYLQRNLVGKRISGKFLKFDGKNWNETENVTFRVNRIVNWEVEGDINVKDEEGNTYAISINQKIHIG